MSLVFGTSPDSWGVWYPDDSQQPSWQRFLDEAAKAGYRLIELGPYGYLPTDADALSHQLSMRGLSLVAGTMTANLHDAAIRPEALSAMDRVARLTAAVDGSFVVLMQAPYRDNGVITGPRELDVDGWSVLLATIEEMGSILRDEHELELVVHPHADTCIETPAQVQRLLMETDADWVSLCLDTGHYEYRGGSSADLLRRFPTRIPYLHLKSIRNSVSERANAEDLGFGEAVALGVVCEPSEGSVDFEELASTMRRIDYEGQAVAEHDMYPVSDPEVPLRIAQRTRLYYERLGWSTSR